MSKADLRERVADLPTGPGVYMLKDRTGRVLYVGKAANLRSRVRSYLGDGAADRPHLAPYLKRWRDLQVITTETPAEALVLENSFIKKERPPANVMLRDDKRYLCVRVDLSHDFPRIRLVRRFRKDGALYFGPYANAKALRHTLRALRELYPLRSCSDHTLAMIQESKIADGDGPPANATTRHDLLGYHGLKQERRHVGLNLDCDSFSLLLAQPLVLVPVQFRVVERADQDRAQAGGSANQGAQERSCAAR